MDYRPKQALATESERQQQTTALACSVPICINLRVLDFGLTDVEVSASRRFGFRSKPRAVQRHKGNYVQFLFKARLCPGPNDVTTSS